MALGAIAECKLLGFHIALDIYGFARESYLRSLQALVFELGIEDRVTWRGRLHMEEVSNAYLGAHLGLVLYEASDPGNDGLSNKIFECVSTGRPVLAGDLPENRSFVKDNDVGWLAEMSVVGLATALCKIAAENDLDPISRHCRHLGDNELNLDTEFTLVTDFVFDHPRVY